MGKRKQDRMTLDEEAEYNFLIRCFGEWKPRNPQTNERRMTRAEAVDRLHAIRDRWNADPETAHQEAESVLLLLAGMEVQAAYQEVVNACKWWAYA